MTDITCDMCDARFTQEDKERGVLSRGGKGFCMCLKCIDGAIEHTAQEWRAEKERVKAQEVRR